MNRKIGIFDSGIGGVTVLRQIIKKLPNEDYIYYSDSINNPYGNKTQEEIVNICDNIVEKLINRDCKAIVIACNTASARAANFLREKYSNIPIIAIEPAYKMVHDYANEEETLILATKSTIESKKFELLYNKYNNHKTYTLKCIGLAELIEEEKTEEVKEYLKNNIGLYRGKIKNVVLGCTHYPLIEKELKEVLGEVRIFEGAEKVAKYLKDVLEERNLLENGSGKIEFIDSSMSSIKCERFYKILKR